MKHGHFLGIPEDGRLSSMGSSMLQSLKQGIIGSTLSLVAANDNAAESIPSKQPEAIPLVIEPTSSQEKVDNVKHPLERLDHQPSFESEKSESGGDVTDSTSSAQKTRNPMFKTCSPELSESLEEGTSGLRLRHSFESYRILLQRQFLQMI